MLLSEYIGVTHEQFSKYGILDTFIELDANYYINVFALQRTKIKEFENSYSKISEYFNKIFRLLNAYVKNGNKVFYYKALECFNFPEVNELGIGLSQGNYGRGLTSPSIRKKIIDITVDLIKEGNNDPDLFLLIGILSEGIGVDFISDMICNIIIDDIREYTKEMNKQMFSKADFIYNEEKKCLCYYIPLELVDEIPIPKFMYDVDTIIRLNDGLRSYMNEVIGESFLKASKQEKTNKIVEYFKNQGNYKEIIKMFNDFVYEPYDFEHDDVGIIKLIQTYLNFPKIQFNFNDVSAKNITLKIIKEFKKLIENSGLYEPFLGKSGRVKEKNCQSLFYIYSKKQFEQWNFDLSPECNQGRGPSDFKVSLGSGNKCIIEVKLLSNKQYSHGLDVQLIEYAKAEDCKDIVYFVFDDMDDREKAIERLAEISSLANAKKNDGYIIDVIIVRLEKKLSASVF